MRVDFINYYEVGDDGLYRGKPETLYLKNSETECFLSEEQGTRFVDFDYYVNLVGAERRLELENFLCELGVRIRVELTSFELNEHEVRDRVIVTTASTSATIFLIIVLLKLFCYKL